MPLPYDTEEDVRERLVELAPHLQRLDATEPPLWLNGEYFKVRARASGSPALLFQRVWLPCWAGA